MFFCCYRSSGVHFAGLIWHPFWGYFEASSADDVQDNLNPNRFGWVTWVVERQQKGLKYDQFKYKLIFFFVGSSKLNILFKMFF